MAYWWEFEGLQECGRQRFFCCRGTKKEAKKYAQYLIKHYNLTIVYYYKRSIKQYKIDR